MLCSPSACPWVNGQCWTYLAQVSSMIPGPAPSPSGPGMHHASLTCNFGPVTAVHSWQYQGQSKLSTLLSLITDLFFFLVCLFFSMLGTFVFKSVLSVLFIIPVIQMRDQFTCQLQTSKLVQSLPFWGSTVLCQTWNFWPQDSNVKGRHWLDFYMTLPWLYRTKIGIG